MSGKTKRVCVDVGGTFTDCLVMDETGLLQKFKSSTTPSDPSKGFMDAMKKAARHYGVSVNEFLGQIEVLVHGTTLATNILLTGRGAKAGMLTTKNFRDIIELRRAMKPQDVSLYNLFIPPARPLIPRSERIGIEERTLYNGEVMTPLNEQETADAVRQLKAQGVESIAVCFLHSYANPTNERRAAEICGEIAPDIFVTTSHETLPVWREFERFNTTAVGAYVGPAVGRYLTSLERVLKESGFHRHVPDDAGQRPGAKHFGMRAPPGLPAAFRPGRGPLRRGLSRAPSRRRTPVVGRHGRHQLRRLHDQQG